MRAQPRSSDRREQQRSEGPHALQKTANNHAAATFLHSTESHRPAGMDAIPIAGLATLRFVSLPRWQQLVRELPTALGCLPQQETPDHR